jgi:hypothetical protein
VIALSYKTKTGICFCSNELTHLAFQRYSSSQDNQLLSFQITRSGLPSDGHSTELHSSILFIRILPISLHFYELIQTQVWRVLDTISWYVMYEIQYSLVWDKKNIHVCTGQYLLSLPYLLQQTREQVKPLITPRTLAISRGSTIKIITVWYQLNYVLQYSCDTDIPENCCSHLTLSSLMITCN